MEKWDCKDVTVGNCSINEDDIIDEDGEFTDLEQCQQYCLETSDCIIFRFDGEICTLLKADYRTDCDVIGGPFNQSFDGCFEEQSPQNCNLLFQEDCTYAGNGFIATPNGTVVDPKTCEELCFEYHDLNCEYWLYDSKNASCILFDSKERSCQTWGGPEYPAFSFCIENMSKNYFLKNKYAFNTI